MADAVNLESQDCVNALRMNDNLFGAFVLSESDRMYVTLKMIFYRGNEHQFLMSESLTIADIWTSAKSFDFEYIDSINGILVLHDGPIGVDQFPHTTVVYFETADISRIVLVTRDASGKRNEKAYMDVKSRPIWNSVHSIKFNFSSLMSRGFVQNDFETNVQNDSSSNITFYAIYENWNFINLVAFSQCYVVLGDLHEKPDSIENAEMACYQDDNLDKMFVLAYKDNRIMSIPLVAVEKTPNDQFVYNDSVYHLVCPKQHINRMSGFICKGIVNVLISERVLRIKQNILSPPHYQEFEFENISLFMFSAGCDADKASVFTLVDWMIIVGALLFAFIIAVIIFAVYYRNKLLTEMAMSSSLAPPSSTQSQPKVKRPSSTHSSKMKVARHLSLKARQSMNRSTNSAKSALSLKNSRNPASSLYESQVVQVASSSNKSPQPVSQAASKSTPKLDT